MKIKIFFLFLLLSAKFSIAQNIAIDTVLRAGFYKNIDELVDNNPSIPFDYKINETAYTQKYLFHKDRSYPLYELQLSNLEMKEIGKVSGFSDGKDIYIISDSNRDSNDFTIIKNNKIKNYQINKNTRFTKVLVKGIYMYFNDVISPTYINSTSSYRQAQYFPFILNIKEKKIVNTYPRVIKKLIKDEEDIHLEYIRIINQEKPENIQNILIKYNERYRIKMK